MDRSETAQLYASVGLVYSFSSLFSIVAYRYVYDVSLEVFPSAYLLMSSSLFILAAYGSFVLYTQKRHFDAKEAEEQRGKELEAEIEE